MSDFCAYVPTPRVTLNSFKRTQNLQEEREVRAYILKNMGDFDITKRIHTPQEKHRIVNFIMGTQQHFAVALVVRVLLEARGEFEKSNVQVSNMANKILKWMRLYQEKGMEGLQSKVGKQPGQHESKRKFNLELIKEAILALGSSGGHHCYSTYYRYYLELERAKNPHFSAHYSKFVDHARRLIEGDKTLQSLFIGNTLGIFR
ncbi:hypothetical protein [Helicobacter felis]|uniref:hypothetical protein n=2 Tax=Helicobacter felis TaxID=214 RepID=UPI00059C75AC|nr:hypothetical protein [Helicobacter felis]